jgi:hypothetical protein
MLQVDRTADQAMRFVPATHPAWPVLIGLGGLTLLGVVTSASPLVVLASGIVAILVVALLWRPGQPPLLLVPVFLQFTQVALKPAMTASTAVSLQELAEFNIDLESAALFGLAGIAALAFGLRIGAGDSPNAKDAVGDDWPLRRIVALSLLAIVAGHAIEALGGMSGGARQIALALGGIKWAGLFVLGYSTLRQHRGLRWLVAVVFFEIALGMTGFFADFRLVLFVLIGAAIAAYGRVSVRGIVAIVSAAALTLVLAVFWTSGKSEYRAFLNQGTGEQVILRPLDERLAYLAEKMTEFDGQKFAHGFEILLERISYIEFLAATMERVPKVIPYEGGARLGEAVQHVLTPRILFPDKPEVPSDTQVTAYYTALPNVVFADANTSISIGYLGELYVDFGVGGALLAVALIGLVFGRCYRAIRDHPSTPEIVNYGLCMMFALSFSAFETALIRLVGSFLMVAAAALVLQRFVWPAVFPGDVKVSGRRNFGRGNEA